MADLLLHQLYETYSKYASRDKKYATAAGKMFNTALQSIKKIDESPPPGNQMNILCIN